MTINAVVFDYGGVICYPPPAETAVELEHLTGLSHVHLDELNRKFRGEYDRGVLNGKEYFHNILSKAGLFLDETSLWKIAQADMDGYKHLDYGTIQLIRDIKKAGIKTAILSNMPNDFLVWAKETIPVFNEVDAAIFSCEHFLLKPETEIFEKLRDKLNMGYEEMVYFDDLPENIIRARELGINGFVWINPDDARKTLRKISQVFETM